MKKRHSLKIQFTLFFLFFVIAVYSIVIVTSLQQLVGITETIGAQLGFPILDEVTSFLDGDAFEGLSKSLDLSNPFYEETRLKMLAIKEKSDCIYLYTMVPAGGNIFRYIIDGSTSPDDSERFSPLGTDEDISSYIQPVLRAMEQKTAQVNSLDFNNQWGWFVSAFAPIFNSSGKAVGIIGCDFKADRIYERLWSQIARQLIISGLLVLAGFGGYLYMVNGVNKQNRKLVELKDLAETARQEAEAVSLALKDERDTISAMKDALRVGLFFMDKNFIIQDHYSRYLETLLGIKNLAGENFTSLLSASINEKDKQRLVEYFVLLFNRSVIHKMNEKMLEELNPIQELHYTSVETKEEKILHWTFVPVDRGSGRLFVLGNIQDITNEKKMQERLASLDKH